MINSKIKLFALLLSCLTVLINLRAEEQNLQQSLQVFADRNYWLARKDVPALSREELINSIEAMRTYFLNRQYTTGNFLYGEDIVENHQYTDDDNQVRQAGAFWGVCNLLRERFNGQTLRASLLCYKFFKEQRKAVDDGKNFVITYPEAKTLKTGTVALFCLGLIDFMLAQQDVLTADEKIEYTQVLNDHLKYLQSIELPDGTWSSEMEVSSSYHIPVSSPYYDGEALLAYCLAARYLGHDELLPRIKFATPKLAKKYTLDCWQPGKHFDDCKGFYQWGCMAFAEYVEAGWDNPEIPSLAARALTWWMIEDNNLLYKDGNNAYGIEGLMGAWRIAVQEKDTQWADELKNIILVSMAKLTMTQIGGPFHNKNIYLTGLPNIPPKAYGGIMSSYDSGVIRIDFVQHQLHAALLVLKYLY